MEKTLLSKLEELNKLNDYCYLKGKDGKLDYIIVVNIMEEHDDVLYDVYNDMRIQDIADILRKMGVVFWYKKVLDNCMGLAFFPGKILLNMLEGLEYDN